MAENRYLNLSGLQYYTRKLDEKKADIESPAFTGTPTINNSLILTNDNLVRVIDGSKLLLNDYLTREEVIGQLYYKKNYTITDENVIREACDCFKNDSNIIEICNSLNIYFKSPISTSDKNTYISANEISINKSYQKIELSFYEISDETHQNTYYVNLYLNEDESSITKIVIRYRNFSDDLYTRVSKSNQYFIDLNGLKLEEEASTETKVEGIHDFLSYSTTDSSKIKSAISSMREFPQLQNETQRLTLQEMYDAYYRSMPLIRINKNTITSTSINLTDSKLYITFSLDEVIPDEDGISYRNQDAVIIFTQSESRVASLTVNIDIYTGPTNIRLESKADLDSPTFTGTPTAPTPEVDDNSNAIATTAFVRSIVPEDVAEVGIKLTNLENRLFDRILDSTELTPIISQSNAGINASCKYGSGSYYVNHNLNRYEVSVGDKIKITGTALSAKENYYIWSVMSSSAFGSDKRRGPICNKDANYEIDDTITIAEGETHLFVTVSNDIKVIKIGEMQEGQLTTITSSLLELENDAATQTRFLDDHLGNTAKVLQASHESFKFIERCKDIIYAPINQRNKTHMVYCIPDLHKDYDCLASHLTLFANTFNGSYANQAGAYGMDGMCKVIVTAGDILFNGGTTVVPRDTIIQKLAAFNEACKPYVSYNTYVLPAIGGHDFNDHTSAIAGRDDKKVANNLTKRDQYNYIINPALSLVRSAITVMKPTIPTPTENPVYAPCYYAVKDNATGSYYIVLDECDHNSMVTGTYNGATVTWKMTNINWTTNTFTAIDTETNTTYSNVPMGEFEYVYSRYNSTTYSNEQLNWVADLMSNAPEGTHFWFFNHSGLRGEISDNSGGRQALKNMIAAYVNRTTYSASGNSTAGDLAWSIDVDFTSATGTVIGIFRGHGHDCVEYDLGAFKEYMSDTPGNYSSTVKSTQIFSDKFSGDLFVYKDSEQKLYRLHHGRRRPGIDDAPTIEEKYESLLARVEALEQA